MMLVLRKHYFPIEKQNAIGFCYRKCLQFFQGPRCDDAPADVQGFKLIRADVLDRVSWVAGHDGKPSRGDFRYQTLHYCCAVPVHHVDAGTVPFSPCINKAEVAILQVRGHAVAARVEHADAGKIARLRNFPASRDGKRQANRLRYSLFATSILLVTNRRQP